MVATVASFLFTIFSELSLDVLNFPVSRFVSSRTCLVAFSLTFLISSSSLAFISANAFFFFSPCLYLLWSCTFVSTSQASKSFSMYPGTNIVFVLSVSSRTDFEASGTNDLVSLL